MRHRGWSRGSPKQIQDGGCRHLKFWKKNINNSGLDKKYLHKISCEAASEPCGDDQVTKKSKPEVNSRDVIKYKSEAYVRRSQ